MHGKKVERPLYTNAPQIPKSGNQFDVLMQSSGGKHLHFGLNQQP